MQEELAARLATQAKDIKKDIRSDAIKIGIASFVLGVGATIAVTLLIHPPR